MAGDNTAAHEGDGERAADGRHPGGAPAGGSVAGASTWSPRSMLLPLALAQFIASYACTNMNVAVSNIAHDLNTTVIGVQTAITVFTLTMAALMIPGSKLSDIWGRKACFRAGLIVYGLGALVAALAPAIGVLIVGYSLLEGIGSALMIPPIYILVTVYSTTLTQRARALGVISAAAGLGAATGPLIGGLITSTISWRASFILQVLVVILIIIGTRRIRDAGIEGAKPQFDVEGAVLSAVGLFFVVLGILQSGTYGWFTAREDFKIGSVVIIPKGGISPVWLFVAIGAVILVWFFLHIRRREHKGRAPLLSTALFRSRMSNLGLVTQNVQWLVMQGAFFVISVYLQTIRHHNAIETGLILTPATLGILVSSVFAGRLARRRSQRFLIRSGFVGTVLGVIVLLVLVPDSSSPLSFAPGLLIFGLGVGVMLTASANVVQSAFPENLQGEISGLSRSVSNLGSSLGTAIVGSVLVSAEIRGGGGYAAALVTMTIIALIGLAAALLLPPGSAPAPSSSKAPGETDASATS
jgi:MFS family permease